MADQRLGLHINSSYDGKGFKGLHGDTQHAQSAIGKLKSSLTGIGSSVGNMAKGIGSNLMNIKAGFDMISGACKTMWGWLKKSIDFETTTHQFKYLIGSMDEAKEHMQMLQELGNTPPFSMEEFAAASRQMMILTDGALGLKGSLEMVGDVAAATGVPVEQVGEAVARAYALIRDGQPITRAVSALRNMGAVTPDVAAKLKELQDQGADNVQIWNTLTEALGKYTGAMAETENTTAGKLGAIQSRWDDTMRSIGGVVTEQLDGPLTEFIEGIQDWADDGSLEIFLENFKSTMSGVGDVCKGLFELFGNLKRGIMDTVFAGAKDLEEVGDILGTFLGAWWETGSIKQARSMAADRWIQIEDYERPEDERQEEEIRQRARMRREERRAARKDRDEKKSTVEQKKIIDDLKNAKADIQIEQQQKQVKEKIIKDDTSSQKREIDKQIKQLQDQGQKEIEILQQKQNSMERLQQKGIAADQKHHKGLFGQYDYALDENGNIKNFRDFQRAKRYAGRADRENRSDMDSAAKKYDRLMGRYMAGKLSKADEKFMEDYIEFMEQQNAPKKIQQVVERMENDIKSLNRKLENLGAK